MGLRGQQEAPSYSQISQLFFREFVAISPTAPPLFNGIYSIKSGGDICHFNPENLIVVVFRKGQVPGLGNDSEFVSDFSAFKPFAVIFYNGQSFDFGITWNFSMIDNFDQANFGNLKIAIAWQRPVICIRDAVPLTTFFMVWKSSLFCEKLFVGLV